MTTATSISSRIIDAAIARQLTPGVRLGEQQLATLFDCSRTIVREAMVDLAARGIVTVMPRRGWFLTEVDTEQARELYEARQVVETGLLRSFARSGRTLDAEAIAKLRANLDEQKAAIEADDAGRRSFLLGMFHVRVTECLGNRILADALRNLVVLTSLYTMRHQTGRDARRSFEEHAEIVRRLASNNLASAEEFLWHHLGTWEDKVNLSPVADPLNTLRQALAPVGSTSPQTQAVASDDAANDSKET